MNEPSFPGGPPVAAAPLKARRLSTWKIVGIVAAVVVVVLLVSVFWIRSVTERRWARFQEQLTLRADRERARDPRRPVLRGTAEPGNAWDDYKLAIDAATKALDRSKLTDLVQRFSKADLDWGAAAIEKNQIVLDHLRRGASRSTCRLGYDWQKGMSMALYGLGEMQKVVSLAVLKARALAEAGRQREAAGLLLDAAQFGRDVADDGPLVTELVGTSMLYLALDGVYELVTAEKADPEALGDLDQGLSLLESRYPGYGASLRRESLCQGLMFALEGLDPSFTGGWSQALPLRLLYLNAYDRSCENIERSAQAAEGSWSESRSLSGVIDAEYRKAWNPITRMLAASWLSSERPVRERLAQVRLLRVATRYRRTGEMLDLDDPFGGKLKTAKSGEGLKIWSIGSDGMDQGGKGTWKAQEGPDIVVEARR